MKLDDDVTQIVHECIMERIQQTPHAVPVREVAKTAYARIDPDCIAPKLVRESAITYLSRRVREIFEGARTPESIARLTARATGELKTQ